MTYRAFKTFIKENSKPNNDKIFDLVSIDTKSKIVFIVGKNAPNTSAFLTSIMSACELSHFLYTRNNNLNASKRFLQNDKAISIETICENAETILNNTKKMLSNDDLFLLITLLTSNCEYTIIEMSEDYYSHIKDIFTPFALVLAINNDETANGIIQNAKSGIKEIISLSQKEDFDYISSKTNPNGARITFASKNKITVSSADLLKVGFYHFSYLYHVSVLDLNNVYIAHLALEAASAIFNAPRPYIYKGLENARIPNDLILYSLSPNILLREGSNDFILHHKLHFKTVNENDEFLFPCENTVFCGNKEYIDQIKERLKERKRYK